MTAILGAIILFAVSSAAIAAEEHEKSASPSDLPSNSFQSQLESITQTRFDHHTLRPSRVEVATAVHRVHARAHERAHSGTDAKGSEASLIQSYENASSSNIYLLNSGIDAGIERKMIRLQSTLYAHLVQHGLDNDTHRSKLYSNLLLARDEAADGLWRMHADALGQKGPPPEFSTRSARGQHTIWRWPGEGNRIFPERIDLQADNDSLLVIASPGCPYAREALQQIRSRSPHLMRNAWVLLSPQQGIKWHFWKQWQDEFPDVRFGMIDRLSDWPELSETRVSPAFYHFRNGQLVKYTLTWEDLLPTMPAPDKQP